jgi:hypothetical protein
MMGKQSSIAKRLVEMSPLGGKHKRGKLQDLPNDFLVQLTPAAVGTTTLHSNPSQRELV